jgi:Flp pilus assembly protein TadD
MSRGRQVAVLLVVVAAAAAAFTAVRRNAASAPRRVVVVGLDGADWQLLDGYVTSGAMPNLARLAREGRTGTLRSLVPSLSPLVWTTIATGVSPLQHGILDFTRFNPQTGQREPITSDERRVKAVWEMAGDSGRDVAVFGLWATHPAEPVRGLMVSDRLFSFQRDEAPPPGVVYPAAEEQRVLAARRRFESEVDLSVLQGYLPWLDAAQYSTFQASGDPYGHPATALRRILVETRLYHHLAIDWLRRMRPALTFVYFQGTDSAGHVFASYAPPRQPAIAQEEFDRYSAVPERYFREVDGLLGEYRAAAEEQGAAILVVSDHGFLWGEGRPTRSDGHALATAGFWHRDDGIYLLWGDGIAPTPSRGEASVRQVAATVLALLGLPRAAGIEGPALGGVPESAQSKDYGPRTTVARGSADPAAEEALEKLRALGYLGGREAAARPEGEKGTRTPGSYNNEGVLLREAGRLDEARRAFEEAVRVDPHAPTPAYNLSLLLADSDPERADALLLGALADGLGEGPRVVVATAGKHQQAGDAARARRLIDGAVERRPLDAGLRLVRGQLRLEERDCAGALADFDAARRLVPRAALAHGLAGTALLCLGREAEGRAALEKSLELDPSQSQLRDLLTRGR